MEMITNFVVGEGAKLIAPVLGGLLGGGVLGAISFRFFLTKKLSKMIREKGTDEVGNFIGLLIWKFLIKKIKNQKHREQVINDFDFAGNNFDEGFDKGIRGVRL